MKKGRIIVAIALVVVGALALVGCGSKTFDANGAIAVVQREDGSGTRTAFEELLGLKSGDVKAASTQNGTGAIISYVSGDTASVGYISAGAVNSSVKALSIDGVTPLEENIASGAYTLFRPFVFALKPNGLEGLSAAALDFYKFVMSDDGAAIVKADKLVPPKADDDMSGAFGKPYETENDSVEKATVKLNGSTSMQAVIEKLIEAYGSKQTKVTVSYEATGSGTGINSVKDGKCDFGLASKDVSGDKSVLGLKVALDGIAIVVNKANPILDVNREQIKTMFTKQGAVWSDFIK